MEESIMDKMMKMVGRIKLANSLFKIQRQIPHEEINKAYVEVAKLHEQEMAVELGHMIVDTCKLIKETEEQNHTVLRLEVFACPMSDFRFHCETMLKEAPIEILQQLRPDLEIKYK